MNPALAESIGVDTNNLLLSQRDCAEQALGLVGTLIRSGSVDVVVVDSVKLCLVSRKILKKFHTDAHPIESYDTCMEY